MDLSDRALDKLGNTIDFYLSPTRNAKAAKRFLGKALNGLKGWEKPRVINTDKAPTYGIAISELKTEVYCHSMDRLARNLDDLRFLVKKLTGKGVKVCFVKESLTFTGEDSPMANLLLSVMGAIAEFERELIKERHKLLDGQSGRFDLESEFTVRCDDGACFTVHGWLVDVEILNVPAGWVI